MVRRKKALLYLSMVIDTWINVCFEMKGGKVCSFELLGRVKQQLMLVTMMISFDRYLDECTL